MQSTHKHPLDVVRGQGGIGDWFPYGWAGGFSHSYSVNPPPGLGYQGSYDYLLQQQMNALDMLLHTSKSSQ